LDDLLTATKQPTEEINEMTLNEDMEKQGHNVEDLIDLWQDTSEAVMRNPQTTNEDLQEEIFKWIRRFREMHKDATRAESEVARLRNALNERGH
jgi:gas vesicle protein